MVLAKKLVLVRLEVLEDLGHDANSFDKNIKKVIDKGGQNKEKRR